MIKTATTSDKKSTTVICPVCKNNTKKVRTLDQKFILKGLQYYYNEYFDNKMTKNLNIHDYSIYRCNYCTLEFSLPPITGNNDFYEWVTSHPNYFHSNRWEWPTIVANLVKQSKKRKIRVLEVGCGSGIFLNMINGLRNTDVIGIDSTPSAVEECHKKGLMVYLETLESFLSKPKHKNQRFDYVIAFHTLEHIERPKEWVSIMTRILKPKGTIILSTPYSPLSFETKWYDPLNYPPHHMTRWNQRAYHELASQLGLKANIVTSPSSSLIVRTLISLNLSWNSASEPMSVRKTFLQAIVHPITVVWEIQRQFKREKVNGRPAGDIALVQINKK
ncbi:MAG: class I SAM-dependent methyltransferase [bacterium]|nr:class I SAM-dependent methyltransferase [bacterium]